MIDPYYKSKGFKMNPKLIKPFYHRWIGSLMENLHLEEGGIFQHIRPNALGITTQSRRQMFWHDGGSTLRIPETKSQNVLETPKNVTHIPFNATFKKDWDIHPSVSIFHQNLMQHRYYRRKRNHIIWNHSNGLSFFCGTVPPTPR